MEKTKQRFYINIFFKVLILEVLRVNEKHMKPSPLQEVDRAARCATAELLRPHVHQVSDELRNVCSVVYKGVRQHVVHQSLISSTPWKYRSFSSEPVSTQEEKKNSSKAVKSSLSELQRLCWSETISPPF